MDEKILCTTCMKELRFGELLSIRPGNEGDNTFHCPSCLSSNLRPNDRQQGKEAA